MPSTISSPQGSVTDKAQPSKALQHQTYEYVIGEINAFIAIRDELLVEAEEKKTTSKLDSLLVANNFVETCLTPAKSPYQVQFLPEPDAKRERKRCAEVKRRVAQLRDELQVT